MKSFSAVDSHTDRKIIRHACSRLENNMKRYLLRVTFFIVLVTSLDSVAEPQLERLVKEQRKNDNSNLFENKIDKKDVLSGLPDDSELTFELPEEALCYPIDKMIIEDQFIRLTKISNTVKFFMGKCLGVKGLEKISQVLQDALIMAGYVTSRVLIPSQDLSSKRLIMRIVPGRVGDIIIENANISKNSLPFSTGDILNLRHIEQGLENIQRTPYTQVKIDIVPGGDESQSNIIIKIERAKTWNVRLVYNNWGEGSTGKNLYSGVGYLYNLARVSDIFYLSGTRSTTGAYDNVSAYYSLPFGFWAFDLFYNTSHSRQKVNVSAFSFDYLGKNEYFNFKTSRTLFRDKDKKLSTSVEAIRRKAKYTLGDVNLALQERNMGNFRLAVNYKQYFYDATLDVALGWQRFCRLFGGKKTPDMLSGSVSSNSNIITVNLDYTKWLEILNRPFFYNMNIGVQYSPDTLTLQDQFSVGGRWTVRGFENSTGVDGNSGSYIRNTLNFITGYHDTLLYVGADYGQVSGTSDLSVSGINTKLAGAVIGGKGTLESFGYDISVSVPLMNNASFENDRFTVSANFSYQI